MKVTQAAIVGGAVSCMIVGIVVGNLAVVAYDWRTRFIGVAPVETAGQAALSGAELRDQPELAGSRSATDAEPEADAVFPIRTDRAGQFVEGVRGDRPRGFELPSELAPIEAANRAPTTLRSVIDLELANASEEERSAWAEELKNVPPETAREIVRLRQSLSLGDHATFAPPALNMTAGVAAAPPHSQRAPLNALPMMLPATQGGATNKHFAQRTAVAVESSYEAARLNAALQDIRRARQVVLNNIANAQTAGFKATRVLLRGLVEDNPIADAAKLEEPGISTPGVEYQICFDAGTSRRSERALDLAIDGCGWFQLRDGAQILYTRAGTFALDRQRRIVFPVSGRDLPLDPEIVLPAARPDHLGLTAGPIPGPDGGLEGLQLADVCTDDLVAAGPALFKANGPNAVKRIASPGQNGLGALKFGAIEDSNVDLPEEMSELARLQAQLAALQAALDIMIGASPARQAP